MTRAEFGRFVRPALERYPGIRALEWVPVVPGGERQRYELIGREDVETPVGHFATTKWRYTSLDDGWTSDLWVAGDVVVRYDRLFELEWYEAGASGPQPIPR